MKVVGVVLHPERDCSGAVGSILDWAARRQIQVLGIDTEIRRLACTAEPVTAEELRRRVDLVVSLGGDGTMLRAMRLADRQRSPVLGVNLGKLGFLAEVDVPDLADALSAIDSHEFTTEPRLAVDAVIGDQLVTAFNDIAFVRFPGQKTAAISVEAAGRPFVWVDDLVTDLDVRHVEAHHDGPALLLKVDPRRGLRESDFATLEQWAHSL